MSQAQNVASIQDSTTDRAVYFRIGYFNSTIGYDLGNASFTKANQQFGASCTAIYSDPTFAFQSPSTYIDYNMNVYINGTLILTTGVPQTTGDLTILGRQFPMEMLFRIVLQQTTNEVAITPTDLQDVNCVKLTVNVLPSTQQPVTISLNNTPFSGIQTYTNRNDVDTKLMSAVPTSRLDYTAIALTQIAFPQTASGQMGLTGQPSGETITIPTNLALLLIEANWSTSSSLAYESTDINVGIAYAVLSTSPTGDTTIRSTTNVFVNGVLQISIPPPVSATTGRYAAEILIALQLYTAVNSVVVSDADMDSLNAKQFTIYVIKNSIEYLQKISSPLFSQMFIMSGGYPESINSDPGLTVFFNAITSFQTAPAVDIPYYPSNFVTSSATKDMTYVDTYGRLITSSNQSGVLDGTGVDILKVQPDTPTFYEKLQGYWKGTSDPAVLWDQNGYIKCSASGTYILYPLTTKGFITLTIMSVIPSGNPTEIAYFGFAGCVIDVSNLFSRTTTIRGMPPASDIVNGTITLPSQSVKFQANSYIINLNVLPTPVVQQIPAAIGFSYKLMRMLSLNGSIPAEAYTAIDGSNSSNVSVNGEMTWGTQNANASTSTISVYGIVVANVILKTIDFTPSSIFASQGRNVNLFHFFKTTGPNDRLLEVYNDASDEITVSGDTGILCFRKASVTSLHCKIILSGVELIYDTSSVAPTFTSGQSSIPVTVISDNALTYYVSSGAKYSIEIPLGDEIYLVASTGELIPITDTTATRELTVTAMSSARSIIYSITPLQECLLIHGTPGSNVGGEIHLVPFQSLQDTSIPITCVKDPSGNVTISMPHGPLYQICTTTTFPQYPPSSSILSIAEFNGGSTTFATPSNMTKLYMLPANLIAMPLGSSPDFYTINLIEGTKTVFGLVNKRHIFNASSIDMPGMSSGSIPLPPFITQDPNGPNLLVTRTPGVDMSDTFVAKTTTSTASMSRYSQFVFKVLPSIKLKQTLFYAADMRFTDILPMGDYEYDTSLDLSALIKPTTGVGSPGSTTRTIDFSYGEFRTTNNVSPDPSAPPGGVFTLILTDKKITSKQIYLVVEVIGTTMHTLSNSGSSGLSVGAGDEIDIVSAPYTSNGVTFTGLPIGGPITSIRIELDRPGLDVGQYFIVDTAGNSKLYNFQNVPAPIHPDVYLFSMSSGMSAGNVSWTADVPVKLGSTSYSIGQAIPLGSAMEVTVVLDYDNTSPYYMSGVSFNIVDVEGNPERHSFCQDWAAEFQDPIDSFMITPPNRQPYSGSAAFKTTLFDVKMTNNVINVQTIKPASGTNAKSSTETLYVITYKPQSANGVSSQSGSSQNNDFLQSGSSSGMRVITTHVLQLTALPIPFNPVENFQYYNGEMPSQPVYSGQGTISDVSLQYVLNPSTSPTSETVLKVGQNLVSYSFTPPGGMKETGFSSTFNIKIIPKPANINLNRILKVDEVLKENVIAELFTQSSDYTVTDISIDGASVISSIPLLSATGSQNGLTITLDSAQQMTFQATQAGATTPGSANPMSNGHQIVITIDYYPTSVFSTSMGLASTIYKTTTTITLSIFVWDPTNVRQVLARGTTDTSGTPRTQANSTPIACPTSASSILISFNHDGQELKGTSDDVIDWSEYSTTTRMIYLFSTTTIVRNYFIFTSEEVVLFTVLIFPQTIAPVILKFPSTLVNGIPTPTTPYTVDLLEQFFPDQETALLNAGVVLGLVNNVPAPSSTLTAYQATYVAGNVSTSVQMNILVPATSSGASTSSVANPTTIATLNYTCVLIQEPTLVVQSSEFIIPINQAFTVASEMVSLDSQLSSSAPSVRNSSTGITVSFSTQGMHSVDCILTNQGITKMPITITFLAYDPATTQDIQQTNWTGTFNPIFTSNVPSTTIASYSIGGTNYSLTTSQFVSAILGMELTVQLTKDQPTIVIVVKLSDGNVGIFKGTYMIVNEGTQKQFLVEGATNSTQFTFDQLSDVPLTTPNTTITYTSPDGSTSTGQGYAIYGPDGNIVAYITAPGGTSIFLFPVQPGVLDLTGLAINIGTASLPINPYVETLAQIVTQTMPILIETGNSLNYDLNNFVVSGVGQVIFTKWQIGVLSSSGQSPSSSDNGITFSSTLPSWLIISSGILRTKLLTSAGSFVLKCIVQNAKFASLTSDLSFNLIISDPSDTSNLNVILVSNLESTLTLSTPIMSINGVTIAGSSYLTNGIKLVFSTLLGVSVGTGTANSPVLAGSTQQLVTFSTTASLSTPIVLTAITKDSRMNFITITQVSNEKNLNIVAFGYTGSLFKQTMHSTVISYTASGLLVPTDQLTTSFQPNMRQTIGTAGVVINTDGTFQISNAESLTLTVSYTLNNSTASPQTLIVTIGAEKHPLTTINQSPSPVVSLGTNVARVLIAGGEIADGDMLNLAYASFKLNGNNLEISNITSEFQPTLVQAENILTSRINVASMMIDINRDVTTQPIYVVPLNSTIQYILPFEPSRLTYNTMTVNGANQSIKLYTEKGMQFAELTLSGSALTIISTNVIAFSQPVGFMDKNGTFTYIIIQTIKQLGTSSTASQMLSIGSVVQSPSGLTFQTIGTLDGQNIATPGQTLASAVRITTPMSSSSGNMLQVLSTSLTTSFSFYATLSDGSIRFYTLRFVQQTITTSKLSEIPVRSFIGGAQGPVAFLQPGVTISGNFVMNPGLLRVLTLTSPFYGIFTINASG